MQTDAIEQGFRIWAEQLLDALRNVVTSKKLKNKGNLYNSLQAHIDKSGVMLEAKVGFKQYGRLLDMKRRDSDPKRLDRLGHLIAKRDRNRRWYNVTVYRHLPKLQVQLVESMLAAVASDITALSDNL